MFRMHLLYQINKVCVGTSTSTTPYRGHKATHFAEKHNRIQGIHD